MVSYCWAVAKWKVQKGSKLLAMLYVTKNIENSWSSIITYLNIKPIEFYSMPNECKWNFVINSMSRSAFIAGHHCFWILKFCQGAKNFSGGTAPVGSYWATALIVRECIFSLHLGIDRHRRCSSLINQSFIICNSFNKLDFPSYQLIRVRDIISFCIASYTFFISLYNIWFLFENALLYRKNAIISLYRNQNSLEQRKRIFPYEFFLGNE